MRKRWAIAAVTLGGGIALVGLGALYWKNGTPAQTLPASAKEDSGPSKEGKVVNVKSCGARGDGHADDTKALRYALEAAMKSRSRKLYFPAGTYMISGQSGTRFLVEQDGTEIYGDGVGKTLIRYAKNVRLTNHVSVFRFTGRDQSLHDISFMNGADMEAGSRGYTLEFVGLDAGCFGARLFDLDISGIVGGGAAGGAGITTYQPYFQPEFKTTLSRSVAAGQRTVKPASMRGIYSGRTLRMGGAAPENVNVTAVSDTTFTAVFARPHKASDEVLGWSLGNQYAVIERVRVHDSSRATGFIINSCNNVLRDCTVQIVGAKGTQHGFYIQGGHNAFVSCRVEGAAGFSYHNYITVPGLDSSGNRYLDCVSVNPGVQHFIATSVDSDGRNPDVPRGQPMNRYTELIGCIFRKTAGAHKSSPVFGVSTSTGGALISGCVFEDTGYAFLVLAPDKGATNHTATGNVFRCLNFPGQPAFGVLAGNHAVVTGNQFLNWPAKTIMVRANGPCIITGNQFNGSGGTCLSLNGSNVVVSGNRAVLTGGLFLDLLAPRSEHLQLYGNQVVLSGGASFGNWTAADLIPTGSIHDNDVNGGRLVLSDVPEDLDFCNNRLSIGYGGDKGHVMPLETDSGRLIRFAKAKRSIKGGLTVKLDRLGRVTHLTPGDTQFIGFATADASSEQPAILVAGCAPGSIIAGIPTDGPWKAGHIGIACKTDPGKLHDSRSPAPPASVSCVLFLDSGSKAGLARVLVLRLH